MKHLDHATLESVAREIEQSVKTAEKMSRDAARRGAFITAHDNRERASWLAMWARHFRGQAKAARKTKR